MIMKKISCGATLGIYLTNFAATTLDNSSGSVSTINKQHSKNFATLFPFTNNTFPLPRTHPRDPYLPNTTLHYDF